jgi:hypothetical protein
LVTIILNVESENIKRQKRDASIDDVDEYSCEENKQIFTSSSETMQLIFEPNVRPQLWRGFATRFISLLCNVLNNVDVWSGDTSLFQ